MPVRSRLLVPVLVLLGLAVAAIGGLGAPLIPTVARVEHVSLAAAQWTLTIPLIVGAVTTPLLGRLGDGPRRRAVVIGTLAVGVAGGVLTALPLGFAALLTGRGLQGTGLGLTSLAIAIARDHLEGERSRSAVALLSITTVAGVGLGYPLAGVATEYLGLHAAYGAGAAVAAVTLLLAVLVIPASPADRPARAVDLAGALLLGGALAGLLFALSEAPAWGAGSGRVLGLAGVAVLLLAAWVRHELRVAYPLVDLRLVRRRAVLTANVTVLLGGVGMYLLLSLVTRYVQTPPRVAGYGFGVSVVVAGLVLVPFSLLGFVASRAVPALARRAPAAPVLPLSCAVVLLATLEFAVARGRLVDVFVVMGVAGFGVGCVFAAVPAFIVRAVPASETGSAMSFNQVLRTVGFSAGSALSGVVLATATPAGRVLPKASGYQVAAWVGIAMLAVTIAVGLALGTGREPRVPARPADPSYGRGQAAGQR
ncbi:MAG: MFS transporter [Mycobacteriales bacterium]